MPKDIKPSEKAITEHFDTQIKDYDLESVNEPFVIFVTGISGSGKSTIIEKALYALPNSFLIQSDEYRKLHPKLEEFIEKYGRDHAHKKTGNFSNRFALSIRDKAIKKNLNVIYESTFGNIDTARELISSFKESGYSVLVIQLPVNIDLSIERNIRRYELKKADMHTLPRVVSREDIERMAKNYEDNLSQLKQEGIRVHLFDSKQNINDFVKKIMVSNKFNRVRQEIGNSLKNINKEKIATDIKLKL